MRLSNIAPISVLVMTAACAANPKMMHSQLISRVPADAKVGSSEFKARLGTTYRIPASLIVIADELNDSGQSTGGFTIASLPFESDGRIFIASQNDGVFKLTRTTLGATYQSNTRLLQSIGAQVSDDRPAFVAALGSIIGVLGMSEDGARKARVQFARPTVIVDAAQDLKGHGPTEKKSVLSCHDKGDGDRTCGSVTYAELSTDSIQRNAYMAAVKDEWTDTFPVPACRNVTVCLIPPATSSGNSSPGTSPVAYLHTVAYDPDYVRAVRLPPGGSISFHESCGVDVTIGESIGESVWTVIGELATQLKDIKDTRDAATTSMRKDKPPEQTSIPAPC